ncbi:hypothetical protein IGI04_038136 [Brassica rapa subsp. trilocularis]|uniref:Uncharacterized protein n=1 Tax=Brassica rapa subsp. trilocularis TaxID=1813537 RepID=A0ABQ7LLP7_BRACM|nr:hypothetical protein IGI04_038136 [Brassica rapa subsp. trilocularis]
MNNRNKLLFENKEYSVEETVLKILQDSRAWKGTIEANKKQQVPTRGVFTRMLHGTQPLATVEWDGTSKTRWLHQQAHSPQHAAQSPLPL